MNEQLQCQLADACRFYGILDGYNNAVKNLEQKQYTEFSKYSDLYNKGVRSAVGNLIIIVSYVLFSVFFWFVSMFLSMLSDLEILWPVFRLMILASFINLLFPVGIPIGILTFKFTYCRNKEKKNKQIAEEYFEQVYEPIAQECEENIKALIKERNTFANENKHIVLFLPQEYRNATAVIYMEQAVRNCRADSLKEAINLYEDQLHKWKIEQQNQELLDQQALQNYLLEEQRDAMDRMRREQRSTNTALAGIEALQFYNTFCR